MLKTIKSALFLGTALLLIAIPSRVAAQNFDSSGTSNLSGPYLFRYVNFFNDASGNLVESCSLTGVMTFDGAGNYTVANATLYDSAGAGGSGYCTNLGGGTYGVQPNGLAQLDNPLFAATLFGTFSKPVVIASSTEDYYFDLFVALQAPQGSVSNSSFSGTFTAGALDFLNASNSLAREGYFNLHADGNGNITPFSVTGSTASSASNIITQNVGASTYSLSGTSGGTLTFPGSATDPTQIISGSRVLYVSADSNYFLAGSTSGSDMIFGFRAVSGSASNSLLSGTYFLAGLDDNLYSGFLDAFYGSINSSGDGNLIWHERFDDAVDYVTYDSSFYTPVSIGSDGTYYDGTYSYLTGANGNAMMLIGSGAQFSLNIGIKSPTVTPTSTVWLNPVGITNAANYTPITNAFAPGELVILYGNFGVPLDVDTVLPIPTNLDNVQVLVNGRAAPVYYVSKNQISALVPYEVSGDYFATFQVSVNGSKSNTVTVYVDNSSPGIYTMTQNGLGAGALLHADYSLITDSSPAKPGETVLLFMNGLGTVTPAVADGAPGPAPDLAYSDGGSTTSVYLVDGVNYPAQTIVQYAGLAPYYAGLYQVNFTLPTTGVANGDVYIAFNTLEGVNEMATIAVAGFPGSAAVGSSSLRPVRPRGNAIPRRTAGAKSHRRALPERIRK
ncbi:MAG TPA: hypothetical protein VMI94_27345 [Bryobacteraceae bacterium]|nr:hypothetical protein [Bryobacteraceae bacterium]